MVAYKSGYEAAFPYFSSASDFAEKVVTGEDSYDNLWKHMEATKKLLPGLKYESYKDWVDKEITRFERLRKVTH